ncbi:hypothetical protein LCGC14_1160210 [marine sediment metagenome]|uniref:Uncharacterized protein n=1 Tax=marine sediment metagenome TaxID=412755 RepID=A0A0F9LSS3_9ZZZZ
MSGIFETLSGAGGLRAEGKSAQNIANFNAAVALQEAEALRARAGFAQKRQAKRAAEIKSALTAKFGAAGGVGSPVALDLAAEQAAELELENLLIGFEGEVLAGQAESQAELDRLAGKIAQQRGKSAARAANVQFGMQLATLGIGTGLFKGAKGTVAPAGTFKATTGMSQTQFGRKFLTGF